MNTRKRVVYISTGLTILSTSALVFAFDVLRSSSTKINFSYSNNLPFNIGVGVNIVMIAVLSFCSYFLISFSEEEFQSIPKGKLQNLWRIMFFLFIVNIFGIVLVFYPLNLYYFNENVSISHIILASLFIGFMFFAYLKWWLK